MRPDPARVAAGHLASGSETVADWLLEMWRRHDAHDRVATRLVQDFIKEHAPQFRGCQVGFDFGASFEKRLAFNILEEHADLTVYGVYYDVPTRRVTQVFRWHDDAKVGRFSALHGGPATFTSPDEDKVKHAFEVFLRSSAPGDS
jgi:hypothetical protein